MNTYFTISDAWGIFIAGSAITVLSYMLKNFTFEPLLAYRQTKGKIQNRLKYHGNVITNGEFPLSVILPVREELRSLSCELEEKYSAIAFGKHLPTFLNIPTGNDVSVVATQLIFLSNIAGRSKDIDAGNKAVDLIKNKLRIM